MRRVVARKFLCLRNNSLINTSFGIAVGNATQGLEIAIRVALGVSKRSDVISPTVSWISTASSAALAGGNVKFADVKNPTVCVDEASIKNLVTENTAAVVVVHLFGRPVDEDSKHYINRRLCSCSGCNRYFGGEMRRYWCIFFSSTEQYGHSRRRWNVCNQ